MKARALIIAAAGAALSACATAEWRLQPKEPGLQPARLEALAMSTTRCGGPWARDFIDERAAIAATGRAKRTGRVLTIGKSRLRDDPSIPSGAFGPRYEPATYDYVGFYAASEVDLIHAQYYEGDAYLLVDRRSGAAVTLPALPVPSPTGRFFAATSDDVAYNDHGVYLVERTPGGFGAVTAFDEALIRAPCGPVWRSDEELTVQVLKGDWKEGGPFLWQPEHASHWGEASLRRDANGWRYVPPD